VSINIHKPCHSSRAPHPPPLNLRTITTEYKKEICSMQVFRTSTGPKVKRHWQGKRGFARQDFAAAGPMIESART